MSKVVFEDQEYSTSPGESVLDCLTRYGVSVNSSCRAGVCQTCMMVAVEGVPTASSQAGLKDTLKAQNYFLICSCVPEGDMVIGLPDSATAYFDAKVISAIRANTDVIRLRLSRPQGYDYFPGQFLALFNNKGVSRSYSLASVPASDDFLELHIREIPGGQVSPWAGKLAAGDTVKIGGPSGQCVYLAGKPQQPLLLVGTGTGLAPLLGIARDALQQGHTGPIHIYHGSSYGKDLYLQDELSEMARNNTQFHYHPCVSREENTTQLRSGRATDNALIDFPDLSGWRVFLCGNEDMVKGMQKRTFLAGASMQEIFTDPFTKSLAVDLTGHSAATG